MGKSSVIIQDVWDFNLHKEFSELSFAVNKSAVVSIDTEFPGFLRNTPRDAPEFTRYADMQKNINPTKLLQLGVSLFDHDGKLYYKTFQFNFRFDVDRDLCCSDSIEFLRNTSGLDFELLKTQGIDPVLFSGMFANLFFMRKNLVWVCFHGLYDFGYMLKLIMRFTSLSLSIPSFTRLIGQVFGNVVDVKYMARYCSGLRGGNLGLERLANILEVERLGNAHQAGSDSLLTGLVYKRMKELYPIQERLHMGFLYGISYRICENGITCKIGQNAYARCVRGKCVMVANRVSYRLNSLGLPLMMYPGF